MSAICKRLFLSNSHHLTKYTLLLHILNSTEWYITIAQSLMYLHSETVCSRITWFLPKCSGKIIVYQSIQNLPQLVKYSLLNSQNWIHVRSDITLHVNMTALTVEHWLLIKTSQAEKGWTVEKNDCWVSSKCMLHKCVYYIRIYMVVSQQKRVPECFVYLWFKITLAS